MSDDGLDALREKVARHTGAARARPLVELGTALSERYWRAGPGTLAALPQLDEAIQVLDEAYDHLEPGEFMRGQVASQLGWLIGTRQTLHGGPDHDRDTGIRLLDEALSFSQLPQMLQSMSRLILGQLLLTRALHQLQSGDLLMRVMQPGLPGPDAADSDRAVELLRRVRADSATNPQLSSAAETMLAMAETVQAMAAGLSGGPNGLALGPMMEAMGRFQKLQQQMAERPSGAGFGHMPNPFDFDGTRILLTDPLERPVVVVDGEVPAAAPPPRPSTPSPDPSPGTPSVPAAPLRKALLDKLPGPLCTLLDDGAAPPDVGTVDELVALGCSLVEASDVVGTDHLMLAVALYLRSLVDDGGGWGDGGDDDVVAAGRSLLAAAGAMAAEPADTVEVAYRLATLLDDRVPSQEYRTRLAEGFATVTAALRKVGADGLVYASSGRLLLLSATTGLLAHADRLQEKVLVVGDGRVPDGPTVSHVVSGAQVIELAERRRRPLTESVVFVANPRGDRKQATLDALTLRRMFHRRSIGLGQTAENVDGAGTPDDVRARLDASLLHLGCGVSADGALELAGPAVLEPAEIAAGGPASAGGIAVLPPTAAGAAELTEALLASGFVGVIGFRAPVPDPIASLIYFLLHAQLVDEGRDPASAVTAVRRWMADPHRVVPADVPAWWVATDSELAEHLGALVHHGL